MVERALVVVVGGADERAPEPRQREDRPARAGRHDRAADERQVLVAQRHVGAAARPDDRQLGLVVQLLRAQPIGPHSRRVDDVLGTHVEALAALLVAHLNAVSAPVAL